MNARKTIRSAVTVRSVAVAGACVILGTACQNFSPEQNAAFFGTAAGAATGIPLAASGVNPSIAVPVTVGAAAVAAGVSYVISVQEANAEQRRIAEANAQAYMQRQKELQQEQAAQARAKKKPRYIAVKTQKAPSNTGKTQVMVFDTQTSQVVGNNVYDLKTTPKTGEVSKFDTYSAEYVGSGA
jgi:hypothetical protein